MVNGFKSHLTVIGDSTIDNKIWVDGIVWNYMADRLRLRRDDSPTRIKKSHRMFLKPKLSIVEHLTELMPTYEVHDYTNDGFTTNDCLNGAYKDRVFGQGTFVLYPHTYFQPLVAGAENIKQSSHIVLSIGGNDFREFLVRSRKISDKNARQKYIKDEFDKVLTGLKTNYIAIFKTIRALNKDAQIILMTQYYPSVTQNKYRLYPFLREVGLALGEGENPANPLDVIHALMVRTYTDILAVIKNDPNLTVADITSSLNLFESKNYVNQIEPSGQGGKQIAQMLIYLISHGRSGMVYKFPPEFFLNNKDVQATPIEDWQINHPQTFQLQNAGGMRTYWALLACGIIVLAGIIMLVLAAAGISVVGLSLAGMYIIGILLTAAGVVLLSL